MNKMKNKPSQGQVLLFAVATIQLAVVGTYVFARVSNGIYAHEMLPYWANVLLLNGAADLMLLLVWLMLPSGGGKGRLKKHKLPCPRLVAFDRDITPSK